MGNTLMKVWEEYTFGIGIALVVAGVTLIYGDAMNILWVGVVFLLIGVSLKTLNASKKQ
ncbi:MAG: hypothetical protein ABH864_06490 [archaeon]